METKLYCTKQELFNQPHTRYLESESNIMFTQDDNKFVYYKKLYLLKLNAQDVTEVFVKMEQYIIIKNYLDKAMSRWVKEFNGYVFYSMEDFKNCLDYACRHKLF